MVNCFLCGQDVTLSSFLVDYTFDSNLEKPIPQNRYTAKCCSKVIADIQNGIVPCCFDANAAILQVQKVHVIKPELVGKSSKRGRPSKKDKK